MLHEDSPDESVANTAKPVTPSASGRVPATARLWKGVGILVKGFFNVLPQKFTFQLDTRMSFDPLSEAKAITDVLFSGEYRSAKW